VAPTTNYIFLFDFPLEKNYYTKLGWQVLYFSAKGEIYDALKRDIERGTVKYIKFQGITKLGWQVLYFSAKGEIYDALKVDIENGTVNYIKFKGLFLKKYLINSQNMEKRGINDSPKLV